MPTAVALRQDEFLKTADVLTKLDARKRQDPNVRVLFAEAAKRGFAVAPKKVFGFRQTLKPIQPTRRGAVTVKQVVFEMNVQEFSAPRGSKDALAIVTVIITGGRDLEESYEMLLEAPGGNISLSREYMVADGKVVLARSWWSKVKACLKRECIATCVGALITCSGTWIAYLGCVALACGACFTKCAACASCKCRWWCKWGVGCC